MFRNTVSRVAVRTKTMSTGVSGAIIQNSSGAFAKRERAEEELYFRKVQRERIEALRDMLSKEEKIYKERFCEIKTDENCMSSSCALKTDTTYTDVHSQPKCRSDIQK